MSSVQDHFLPKLPGVNVFGTNQRKDQFNPCVRHEVWKWFFPCFFAGFGWYCQSVGLHWATYQYVHKYAIDSKTLAADKDYRTLYDAFEPKQAWTIDTKTIDMIAGMIPMFFMLLTFFAVNPLPVVKAFLVRKCGRCCCRRAWSSTQEKRGAADPGKDHPQHAYILRQNVLRIWTKVMTCAMFLFMCKGTLGAITVVPDSSGWKVCENRLKATGTAWMRDEHQFADMLSIDAIWVYQYHTPLRYCADMMFSGHTFVVTLFALGAYEMMRAFRLENFSHKWTPARKRCVKMWALSSWAAFTVAEQCVEVLCVERSHFHYSMDVFMAIVITFLIYTNGVIAVFAKHWATWGFLIFARIKEPGHGHDDEDQEAPLESTWDSDAGELLTDPKDPKWTLLNSRGDIFIPPCCFPFCFYSGREHVYSDKGIMSIIEEFVPRANKKNEANENDLERKEEIKAIHQYLEGTMGLGDGVMWDDTKKMWANVRGFPS